MEHFAFNCNLHRSNRSAKRAHDSAHGNVSRSNQNAHKDFMVLMFNLNFSIAWLPILAVHLGAMRRWRNAARPHDVPIRLCKTHDFRSRRKCVKEPEMRLVRGSLFGEWCGRATRWMKKREPNATCNKSKDKEGYARNFLLITVRNPWQFIR